MKNNQLEQLYNDLASTTLPIEELAKKYGVSAATIHNIDKGKTHHNSALSYPIRKEPARATINPNKIAFLQLYKNMYKPSVMAAILEINYETACKYYAAESQSFTYIHDSAIEERKYVVDVMAEPRPEFIHDYGDSGLTWNDAVYFKFLYTLNKDEAAIVWCYKKWLDTEFIDETYPITASIDDLRRYLEWDGTKSKLIWFIRGIGNGKVKTVQVSGGKTKDFFFNDFEIRRFRPYLTEEQFRIAEDIIDYPGLGTKRAF